MKQSTINLLPPSIKKSQRYNVLANKIVGLCFAVLVLTLIWAGTVFMILANLEQKNKEKLAELEALKHSLKAKEQIEQRVMLVNERILVSDEAENYPDWQVILDEIAKFRPSAIKLATMQLSSGGDQFVTISGTGDSRRSIIEYQLALENSSVFQDVEITALGSATGESKAISFSMTMKEETPQKDKQ